MNRHTPMTKADDSRETPPELFKELDERFHFDLDGCASHENALCRLYFTEDGLWCKDPDGIPGQGRISECNGLTGPWKGRRVFSNPPYQQIPAFVEKAWDSDAALVYGLIPATRTEQGWWHEFVEPFRDNGFDYNGLVLRTEFLEARRHFLVDGKPIMRKNRDGSLWLSPKTGLPARSSPKFGLVGLIWTRKET